VDGSARGSIAKFITGVLLPVDGGQTLRTR
jgi:hypothetical protein